MNIRLAPAPWEAAEAPAVPRKPARRAFVEHREYVQQQLNARRARVAELVAKGLTRREIRARCSGMTETILQSDLTALGLSPKRENAAQGGKK